MNKQDKIKSRTWKYFIEQKLEEITILGLKIFLGIISFLTVSAFGRWFDNMMINLMFKWYPEQKVLCESYSIGCILGYAFIGILISFFIFFIFFICFIILHLIGKKIIEWIKNNWKKANKRARSDFK